MANADLIARHIDLALDDLKFSHIFEVSALPLLEFRLKNLKGFVLFCARQLDSNARLGSLLVRIEDMVVKNAKQIHGCFHLTDHLGRMVADFQKDIRSLLEYFDEWYQKDIRSLLEYFDGWYHLRPSNASCFSPEAVLEIISSILEALVDVRRLPYIRATYPNLLATIEALEEQLSFMKALISFASKLSVESIPDLLARAGSVAILIAYRLLTLVTWRDLESLVSAFLQKELQSVWQTCTRVLRTLKSQRPLKNDAFAAMKDDAFVAMRHFLDSLISNLWYLLSCGTLSTYTRNLGVRFLTAIASTTHRLLGIRTLDNSMQDVQEFFEGLRSLRAALKKTKQVDNLSVKMKKDIGEAVCDAGDVICSLHHTPQRVDLGLLKKFLDTVNCVLADAAADEPNAPVQEVEVKRMTTQMKRMTSQGASSSTNEVVGFKNDEQLIEEQLISGSKQLKIVSIVGMPGLGKTTLATKLYEKPSVSHHFHVRACCHVSQTVDIKKVLLDLLNQIHPSSGCSRRSTEFELADALRKSLLGRRYLIFLDDVWDTEAWDNLSAPFPNEDNHGSRIILTSRQHDVVPHNLLVDEKPYFLSPLNEEDSLELLQRELSSRLSDDLGMKIAEKCKGLPLMLVIVAGVLKHAETESWVGILGFGNVSITEQCRNTLELSYRQLPDYLKPCLLYFGTFLENQEVSVRRLFRLWIAEGFIQEDDMITPEDHLDNLIGRSLIVVAKQRSLGGVKTCRIHDLIRDFCVQKAKDEHLFHLVRGYEELSEFNEPHDLQRLCIHSEAEHFIRSKLFCPRARSLILNSSESTQTLIEGIEGRCISHTFRTFKRLKVLNLEHVHFSDRFPSEIEQLVQLTFLAILCEAQEIPQWIGNLSGLETLIKLGDTNCELPDSLWNLQKLQYLYLGGGDGYYTFSDEVLDSPITWHKLDRISGVVIPYSKMESLLRKFPNTRKLKCRLQYTKKDPNSLVLPKILSQIQSLSLLYVYDESRHFETQYEFVWSDSEKFDSPSTTGLQELSLPANLKKLTLGGFSLSPFKMSTIGLLPNLEVLKLLRIKFEGRTWTMGESEFSKLRILKLVDSNLTKWRSDEDAEDEPLKCLEKLVLENIGSSLIEMPSCLTTIACLAIIEVSDCYYHVLDMVEGVETRRNEQSGDPSVKIIRNNIRVQD